MLLIFPVLYLYFLKNGRSVSREMAQEWGAWIFLAEVVNSVPNTQMGVSQSPVTPLQEI